MIIKVIKVTQNGIVGYLQSASVFGSSTPIVDNPLEAKNYANEEFANTLTGDITSLRLPNKSYSSMSGVSVDTAHIVEIEVSFKEISIVEAYTPT